VCVYDLIVIGGGAAGVFGAIQTCEAKQGLKVLLLEATPRLLQKVKISGGGRCNVTHHQFDPSILVEKYPRGRRQLRGPFSRFQPEDMVRWLEENGVELKTEADGRMFPVTDSSQTIIDCFVRELRRHHVEIVYSEPIKSIEITNDRFVVGGKVQKYEGEKVLLATGSNRKGYELARSLGHTIVDPVPSLFTFKVRDPRIEDLSGVSSQDVGLELIVGEKKFTERGPLLITHWGFSGPALIRLSAWAARELHESGYRAELRVNWFPEMNLEEMSRFANEHKDEHAKKRIKNGGFEGMPKRYWETLLDYLDIDPDRTWEHISKKDFNHLLEQMHAAAFQVDGKGVFKEEFVTAGGVNTREVDMKTMESRMCPGLYLAGEVLDIDGVTGGFNFQSAWTTAHVAAGHIST
jgi:predicted Rossmann fold flavoprotein